MALERPTTAPNSSDHHAATSPALPRIPTDGLPLPARPHVPRTRRKHGPHGAQTGRRRPIVPGCAAARRSGRFRDLPYARVSTASHSTITARLREGTWHEYRPLHGE